MAQFFDEGVTHQRAPDLQQGKSVAFGRRRVAVWGLRGFSDRVLGALERGHRALLLPLGLDLRGFGGDL